MTKNILQLRQHTNSVKDNVIDENLTDIVHIFLGAAIMALIIVLMGLVLWALYYSRNWRRWGIKASFLSYFIFSTLQVKMQQTIVKSKKFISSPEFQFQLGKTRRKLVQC